MKRLAAGTSALALAALVVAAPARAQQRPPAPPAAAQDARPGMTVLDYDIGSSIGMDQDELEALRRGLASLTISEIAVNPAVRVVERAQLQQILQEQNLGREGRIEGNTIVQIGHLIGAKYMVTGTIFFIRGQFRIDARLFDAETGQIMRTERVNGTLENVFTLVSNLATALMRDANLPPLERRVQEEHQRQGSPPTQAVMAYSRAVLYADRGDTNRAVEQYQAALTAFPNYTQARTDCNRLQQGACT